ncbi:MAG: WYL domain-containing protein, partial [Lachnospiraceae bacterium]|nr:WYL domain-containing protein [Lachnospiraceae bacterium]
MATSNYQKIKLLKLLEMLRSDADETHPLTTDEICRRLEEMEISCDRRTVTKDIELLNQYGYEVLSRMVGHKKGYFLTDRSFSLSELKILIDAVQAASFITEKKSEELIGKIAGLGSCYRADLIKNNLVRFNTSKHTNEQVYYAVLNIETALLERKKVSFFYYDLNENGERVYRKNKRRYIVDPISLVLHEDNYYLLAYSEKYHGRTTYRIDRMETVEIEDERICAEALIMQGSVDEQVKQAFRMYGGRTVKVILQ